LSNKLIKIGAQLGLLLLIPYMMVVRSAARKAEEESMRLKESQAKKPDWYAQVENSPCVDPNLFERSA